MFCQPGTVLTDHMFTVPLDHQEPGGEQIEVFAREVVPAGRRDGGAGLPWLVYLQGGPGFGSPRPIGRESWLNRALDDYRVLLLDQRGTGRSTPASRHTLARLGSPRAQADYLAHFRADSIVRDAELIRRRLLGDEPWSLLGQSFGGFCTVTYLSFAPEGIREALIGGGLPGLGATADDVYRVTYPIVAERNRRHYERFPMDADRARAIARHLAGHEVIMPGGGRLTVPVFQGLGRMLGASRGSDTLHYLLEDAFTGPVLSGAVLSDTFLARAAAELSFTEAPLYALVHEASYAQGSATRWAADRIMAEFPEFDPAAAVDGDITFLFTGEMIYPWMFETDPVLRRCGTRRKNSPSATPGRGSTTRPGSRPATCPPPRRSTTRTCTCRWRCRCPPPARSAACGPGSRTSTSTTGWRTATARCWTGSSRWPGARPDARRRRASAVRPTRPDK